MVGLAALFQLAGISSQSHGPALFRNAFLFLHKVDDGMFGIRIKLRGTGLPQFQYVTRKFDDGTLHSQANAKKRNLLFPHIADGLDLSFHAAFAKSGRDQDAVESRQNALAGLRGDILRRYPLYVDLTVIFRSRVYESLVDRF